MEAQVVSNGRQQLLLIGRALLAQQLLLLGVQLALAAVHLRQRLAGGALKGTTCTAGRQQGRINQRQGCSVLTLAHPARPS